MLCATRMLIAWMSQRVVDHSVSAEMVTLVMGTLHAQVCISRGLRNVHLFVYTQKDTFTICPQLCVECQTKMSA